MPEAIPSMGGTEIGEQLADAARMMPGGCAVEVGTWMGAGTVNIIRGLRCGTALHCFDRFTANRYEVARAARYGVRIVDGQDTMPIVRKRLEPLWSDTTLHRCNVSQCTWDGQPIGLYVDDAGKTDAEFIHKLRTFGPSWLPGAIIVLMDLRFAEMRIGSVHYDRLCGQKRFVDAHKHVLFHLEDLGKNGSMFRYAGGFDFAKLRRL